MRRQSACVALAAAPDHEPAWSGAVALPYSFEESDPRADGGTRRIDILDYDLMIERVVAGVKMRLCLPFTLFEGVAVQVKSRAGGAFDVAVRLAHEDPELSVLLYQASDDRDVTAVWQFWANRLGLPLLIGDGEGGYAEPFPRLGALRVGRPRPRRAPAHFAKRRPRFLVRRRVGRPSSSPVVYREREIIARD